MKEKKNLWMIGFIILAIIVIGYIAVSQYTKYQNNNLNAAANYGFEQGQVQTINAVLSELQSKGYVQITIPGENNQSQVVTLVPYQPPQEGAVETVEE